MGTNISEIGIKIHFSYNIMQHYNDVIMGMIASQITSLTIVNSTVYWGADQRKHQSSASLAFVQGIHRWLVNSPHNGQLREKCFHLMTSSWIKMISTKSRTFCSGLNVFTHLDWMKHLCLNKLVYHWFRYCLTACLATNHHPNQCWFIVNCNYLVPTSMC